MISVLLKFNSTFHSNVELNLSFGQNKNCRFLKVLKLFLKDEGLNRLRWVIHDDDGKRTVREFQRWQRTNGGAFHDRRQCKIVQRWDRVAGGDHMALKLCWLSGCLKKW